MKEFVGNQCPQCGNPTGADRICQVCAMSKEDNPIYLKPCSTCKRTPKIEPSKYANHHAFSVECICGTSTGYAATEEGAAKKWNTRPIEDSLQERIQELERHLRFYLGVTDEE